MLEHRPAPDPFAMITPYQSAEFITTGYYGSGGTMVSPKWGGRPSADDELPEDLYHQRLGSITTAAAAADTPIPSAFSPLGLRVSASPTVHSRVSTRSSSTGLCHLSRKSGHANLISTYTRDPSFSLPLMEGGGGAVPAAHVASLGSAAFRGGMGEEGCGWEASCEISDAFASWGQPPAVDVELGGDGDDDALDASHLSLCSHASTREPQQPRSPEEEDDDQPLVPALPDVLLEAPPLTHTPPSPSLPLSAATRHRTRIAKPPAAHRRGASFVRRQFRGASLASDERSDSTPATSTAMGPTTAGDSSHRPARSLRSVSTLAGSPRTRASSASLPEERFALVPRSASYSEGEAEGWRTPRWLPVAHAWSDSQVAAQMARESWADCL